MWAASESLQCIEISADWHLCVSREVPETQLSGLIISAKCRIPVCLISWLGFQLCLVPHLPYYETLTKTKSETETGDLFELQLVSIR